MGLLTKKDVTLYRGWFKEMAALRGIPVKYQGVDGYDPTIHAELNAILDEPIDMDIIFDDNPKTSTLKKTGWISENPNDNPHLAYLPYDAPNLAVKARVHIPPIDSLNETARIFEVTDITTLLEFPDAWVCKLAPVVNSDIPMTDYTEDSFNYICENKVIERDKELPDGSEYTYLDLG